MPILAILAIVFLSFAFGSLLLLGVLIVLIPDIISTERAARIWEITVKTLCIITLVGIAGALGFGVPAMCIYF